MDPAPFIAAASLTNPVLAGRGLEFTVYRAGSPRYGSVALRIPNAQVITNANDRSLPARVLMAQELAVYRRLQPTAVPVPVPYGLLEVPRAGAAMLASFVPSDDSPAPPHEVGRVLGLLHGATTPPPPADFTPALQEGDGALSTLATRLARRWAELAAFVPDLPPPAPPATLSCSLAPLSRFPPRLLHMDFRAANFRTRSGRIVSVVDWENALVGPAAIDLVRVLETADPGDGFIEGYQQAAKVPVLTVDEETVLRLDAAVMLALVFLSEAPDPAEAAKRVDRIKELAATLRGASRET